MKHRAFLVSLILGVAVLLGIWPLLGNHYIPSHDGEYHIIRFFEFNKMLAAGHVFPRWAPTLNSGYGLPLFTFHYPFPNYTGSVFHLFGASFVRSFRLSLAAAYALAAVFCYVWLKKPFGRKAALVGTVVGAFVPYWFLDMYVRGSVGEVWAIAFLFACLAAVEYRRHVLFAFAFALMVVSHNIQAMVFAGILFPYILIRRFPLWPLAGGIGLSAYFWMPALGERKYMTGLNTVDFREHFVRWYELVIPSWGTEFSATGSMGNKMSFQIGLVPIVLIIWAGIRMLRNMNLPGRRIAVLFFASLIPVLFLMGSSSEWVWAKIPLLAMVQYPWRLLSVFIPFAALSGAIATYGRKRAWVAVLPALIAVVAAIGYARPVLYAPRDDTHYLSRKNFTDGTSSMGNSFSTVWTGWKAERALEPVTAFGIGSVSVSGFRNPRYTDMRFTAEATGSVGVRVHTLYFPGWMAYVDGKKVPIEYGSRGTIDIAMPAGRHDVRIVFRETPLRLFADVVSVFSLVLLGAWAILERKGTHRQA